MNHYSPAMIAVIMNIVHRSHVPLVMLKTAPTVVLLFSSVDYARAILLLIIHGRSCDADNFCVVMMFSDDGYARSSFDFFHLL